MHLEYCNCHTTQLYGAIVHEPGARKECIESQVALMFCSKNSAEKVVDKTRSHGMLIFDEMKVPSSLEYSCSHQFMGLAMAHKRIAFPNNYYQILKKPEVVQTSYNFFGMIWLVKLILLDHIIPSTVQWTVNLLMYPSWRPSIYFCFMTLKLLVCDDASPNIMVMKRNHRYNRAY